MNNKPFRYGFLTVLATLALTSCGYPEGEEGSTSSEASKSSETPAISTNPTSSTTSWESASSGTSGGTSQSSSNTAPTTSEEQEENTITYWCPTLDNVVMTQLIQQFKASSPKYANVNITCKDNYGEGDCYFRLNADFEAAADVIFMTDDHLQQAARGNLIAPIDDDDYGDTISAQAIQATSYNGEMYGYAYRADNGPMPIYDSSFLSEDDVLSFETVLQKSKAAGKKVYFDLVNGWYNPTLLWTGGGSFTVNANGEIATNVGGSGSARASVAYSLQAFKDLYNQYKDTLIVSSDMSQIEVGFYDRTVSYAFLWNDLDMIKKNNAAATVATWPTIQVDGKSRNMDCFMAYKAVVCKNGSDSERLVLAKAFAKFISSKDAQKTRMEKLQYGPANLDLLGSDAMKNLPFAQKIMEMEAAGRTHSQAISTTNYFWDPMGDLGRLVVNGEDNWGMYASASKALDGLASSQGWVVA